MLASKRGPTEESNRGLSLSGSRRYKLSDNPTVADRLKISPEKKGAPLLSKGDRPSEALVSNPTGPLDWRSPKPPRASGPME